MGQCSDIGRDLRGSVGGDPRAAVKGEGEDLPLNEVGEKILSLQRFPVAAIDVTTCDGVPDGVVIRIDRRDYRPGADGVSPGEERWTLEMIPTVIGALLADVDLFPSVLADVGDVEVSGGAVEARPPRVAQA